MLHVKGNWKKHALCPNMRTNFQFPFSRILTWVTILRVSFRRRPVVLSIIVALSASTWVAKCMESAGAARCKSANLLHRSARECMKALAKLRCCRHFLSWILFFLFSRNYFSLFSFLSITTKRKNFELSKIFSHFVLTFDERAADV